MNDKQKNKQRQTAKKICLQSIKSCNDKKCRCQFVSIINYIDGKKASTKAKNTIAYIDNHCMDTSEITEFILFCVYIDKN